MGAEGGRNAKTSAANKPLDYALGIILYPYVAYPVGVWSSMAETVKTAWSGFAGPCRMECEEGCEEALPQ